MKDNYVFIFHLGGVIMITPYDRTFFFFFFVRGSADLVFLLLFIRKIKFENEANVLKKVCECSRSHFTWITPDLNFKWSRVSTWKFSGVETDFFLCVFLVDFSQISLIWPTWFPLPFSAFSVYPRFLRREEWNLIPHFGKFLCCFFLFFHFVFQFQKNKSHSIFLQQGHLLF